MVNVKRVGLTAVFAAISGFFLLPAFVRAQDPLKELRPPKDGVYRGSKSCTICHDLREYKTAHNTSLQGPLGILTTVIAGQTVSIFDPRTPGYDTYVAPYKAYFNPANVLYTIGGHGWMQRYVTRVVPDPNDATQPFLATNLPNNGLVVMGIQWNQRKGRWEDFHGPKSDNTWTSIDFNSKCIGCHTTGMQPKDTSKLARWVEDGIGCEACHGPSNEMNPIEVMTALEANETCGSCHTRGVGKSDHFEFPWNPKITGAFQPKQALASFIDQSPPTSGDFWPDGESRNHHQQWPDFQLSRHNTLGVRCTDCHSPHFNEFKGQLRDTPLGVCLSCHADRFLNSGDRYQHSGHTDKQAVCHDCHMPRTAASVEFGDIRSHTFLMIEPQKTREFGIPSGCVDCHQNGPGSPKSQSDLETFFLNVAPSYRQTTLAPLIATSDRWSGFALANTGSRAARLFFTLFDPDGKIFSAEGVQNPRVQSLDPGQQAAYLVDEYFSVVPTGKQGWVRLSHYSPDLKGFYLEGDATGSFMTGLSAESAAGKSWTTPVLWPGANYKISLSNLSPIDASLTLTPRNAGGVPSGSTLTATIFARGRKEFDIQAIFPNLPDGGFTSIQSVVDLQGQVTALKGKKLATARLFPSLSGSNSLTVPHVVIGDGWETRLTFYNPLGREVEIQIQLRRDAGGSLPYGGIIKRKLGAGAMLNEALSGMVPASSARVEGYLLVKTTNADDKVQGAVSVASPSGAVASFTAESKGRKLITFAHVAQGNGYWTGLALMTPGGGTATLEYYSATGDLVASKDVTLSERRVATLDQLLPVTRATGGYLQVRSSSEVFAIELFGNDRQTLLASVPPQ